VERRLRLRGESEVREARAKGKAYADGPLVARVMPNGLQPAQNRYAVVAGKRVGGAVQRNRTKRLVREALRRLHPTLRPGHDVVVIVRGTTGELSSFDVAFASLERIAKRARLLMESTAANPRPSTLERRAASGPNETGTGAPFVEQVNATADGGEPSARGAKRCVNPSSS
jgi:ribonuclease P protein component